MGMPQSLGSAKYTERISNGGPNGSCVKKRQVSVLKKRGYRLNGCLPGVKINHCIWGLCIIGCIGDI